jgi:protein-tyrosine-phosphatase
VLVIKLEGLFLRHKSKITTTMRVRKLFVSLLTIAITLVACNNSGVNNNSKKPKKMNVEQIVSNTVEVSANVQNYINLFLEEENIISESRKEQLKEVAKHIEKKVRSKEIANLTFICTHNSRRSHMSQIWAQTAAVFYNIPFIRCYSGGTEATAFNYRSVRALRKAGFEIEQTDESKNPLYKVYYGSDKNYLKGFSKKFSNESNPQNNFAAIMTCSHADEACPVVPGAIARFAIPYEDPKAADNTPEEENRYDERCKQIAIEMFYMFSKVNI